MSLPRAYDFFHLRFDRSQWDQIPPTIQVDDSESCAIRNVLTVRGLTFKCWWGDVGPLLQSHVFFPVAKSVGLPGKSPFGEKVVLRKKNPVTLSGAPSAKSFNEKKNAQTFEKKTKFDGLLGIPYWSMESTNYRHYRNVTKKIGKCWFIIIYCVAKLCLLVNWYGSALTFHFFRRRSDCWFSLFIGNYKFIGTWKGSV